MKAELEARIADLEAQLAAERQKLQSMVEQVPAEFHTLTRDVFERIKQFFA